MQRVSVGRQGSPKRGIEAVSQRQNNNSTDKKVYVRVCLGRDFASACFSQSMKGGADQGAANNLFYSKILERGSQLSDCTDKHRVILSLVEMWTGSDGR